MTGKKRTNHESLAFKAKIADLKKEGATDAEIARQLDVSRQYISQVLNQAGLAGRRRRYGPMKPKGTRARLINMIERLERDGESILAEKLRTVLDRRKVKTGQSNGERED